MYNPIISCRINRTTYTDIKNQAEILHEKKSKIVQHVLESMSPSHLLSIDKGQRNALEVLAKLSTLVQLEINQRKKIGNNVNQIARSVNAERKSGQSIDIKGLVSAQNSLKALTKHDDIVDKEVSKLWRTVE